jgi:carbamate kinase
MRIVVAVGGNALLQRGERPDADVQQHHVAAAVGSLASLAADHELVIVHGNGPQVGLLARESADDPTLSRPYPLDALGAQTQGMIGYWMVQGLDNALPGRDVAGLVTQTLVSSDDPSFAHPKKFIGPVCDAATVERLRATRGWSFGMDGDDWRRVVPSPSPRAVIELALVRRLVTQGVIVVCGGGGGIPVVRMGAAGSGPLVGVEAVVDKDLTASLLARALDADVFVVLTDVAAVYQGFGTPTAAAIGRIRSDELRAIPAPDGSMGPKITAVCDFVDATGRSAAIGALDDAARLVDGTAGTVIEPASP